MKAKSLVSEAKAQETREEALGQSVAKMPDEGSQARRRSTHISYANWCKAWSEHRVRLDHRERTDGIERGSIPEVSFDFCYTRARDSETKSARAVCWLVAILSAFNARRQIRKLGKPQLPVTIVFMAPIEFSLKQNMRGSTIRLKA